MAASQEEGPPPGHWVHVNGHRVFIRDTGSREITHDEPPTEFHDFVRPIDEDSRLLLDFLEDHNEDLGTIKCGNGKKRLIWSIDDHEIEKEQKLLYDRHIVGGFRIEYEFEKFDEIASQIGNVQELYGAVSAADSASILASGFKLRKTNFKNRDFGRGILGPAIYLARDPNLVMSNNHQILFRVSCALGKMLNLKPDMLENNRLPKGFRLLVPSAHRLGGIMFCSHTRDEGSHEHVFFDSVRVKGGIGHLDNTYLLYDPRQIKVLEAFITDRQKGPMNNGI